MIDLEEELARIVELAPEPPDVAGVERRAKQRRTRRLNAALIAAVVVVAVGSAAAFTLRPDRGPAVVEGPAESVSVTLLDGSTMTISGPASLGLEQLQPAFNGQIYRYRPISSHVVGHSFTVERAAPTEQGEIAGRYATGDGHELVVRTTEDGANAVVQYDHWALVVSWNHDPTGWAAFASALHATENAGFLVFEPAPGWRLGPTDAPDVQLGGEAYGSDASFSFFGPSMYPAGCPKAAETSVRTGQGWPVSHVNGTWWCDADQRVRVRVGDAALVEDAMHGLRVTFTP